VAQALPSVATQLADGSRAIGGAAGHARERAWLRAHRWSPDDRGPSAGRHDGEGTGEGRDDARLLGAAKSGRVRIAIGRASDFFGVGVTQSTLGERVFANAVADKRADFIGDPTLLHTCSYVPDIAAELATLGTDERAIGEVWPAP